MCPISAHAVSQIPPIPLGQLVITRALAAGVDPVLAVEVVKCESGVRHEGVYGDNGLAYGIAQFHFGTFNLFKKEAGHTEFDYSSASDQIDLFVWALGNGKASHWTCWRKLVGHYS